MSYDPLFTCPKCKQENSHTQGELCVFCKLEDGAIAESDYNLKSLSRSAKQFLGEPHIQTGQIIQSKDNRLYRIHRDGSYRRIK